MTCVEELTQKLAKLGLTPLPSHINPFLEAICEGQPADFLATLIFRWNDWPRLLLELARRHQLSDADAQTLRDIYLVKGDRSEFQTALTTLTMRGQEKNASANVANAFDLRAARAKVAASHQLATIFDEILMEERARLRKGQDWPDKQTVQALRADFKAGHLSLRDLRSRLTKIASNTI